SALWVAATMAVVSLALGVWVEASVSSPSLLVPTGHYAIGRVEFDWIDGSRSDPFDLETKRELDTFLWYPAEKQGGSPGVCLRGNWTRNLDAPIRWAGYYSARAHSWEKAPLACPIQKSWPVVVLSTGFGHVPADYTSLAEALASEGYV